MKSPRYMDFALLSEVESASLLIDLSRELEDQLKPRPYMEEFHHRAKAALMFLLKTNANSEPWRNEAYIRAGLNEVYSLEDAARRAYRRSNQAAAVPLLCESSHPLVHLMYSLRHINVHVKPSATRVDKVTIRLNDPKDDREFTWGAVMLSDETESDLINSSEVKKHYRMEDVRQAMVWVFRNQQAFGIGQVFRLGAEAYCREVVAALSPKY